MAAAAGCDRRQPAAAPAGNAADTRGVDLDCGWLETTLDGRHVKLRAYNGTVPGPLLDVRPGETLRINLRNSLTPYDSRGWTGNHNVPHRLDSTNLHLHGMDVVPHLFEPVGTSDPLAMMIEIRPGAAKEYIFQVPPDHAPGLYWYHPHLHGSTAVQAVSGMAGGVIVRGAIDEVPAIKAARDLALVANDIGLFPSETVADLWIYEPVQNSGWNTLQSAVYRWNASAGRMEEAPALHGGFTTGDYRLRYYLVNGQPTFREEHNAANPTQPVGTPLSVPRFTLRPGEVVRFRMLNANSDNLMPVVVEGHDVYLVALDGVDLLQTQRLPSLPITGGYGTQQLLLVPANRAEFMIRAVAPNVYRIVQNPVLIKDTQWIDPGTTVVVRIRFKEFRGKTVFHCHILPHEDTGMMQNLLIV